MPHRRGFILVAAILLLVAGCPKKPPPTGSSAIGTRTNVTQDHLATALDFVSHLEEFEPEKGLLQVAYHLNRWIGDFDEDVPWSPDPLLERLPDTVRRSAPLTELDRRQYTLDDVRFLREVSWLHSISEWVSRETSDLGLRPWLEDVEQAKGEQHAYELGLALRLFDWTIRNIQLEPLLDYPAPAAGPAAPGQNRPAVRRPPPEQALLGPGYTAFPWQTLMFGRGDAWQRARVFMLLARQRQLDVVLLAFDDPQATPRPLPWLPAAVIDDQLYLFDTGLGLPIPGPGGAGIATLQQVQAQPDLLHALDVSEKLPYAPARANLQQVVALLDTEPEFLARRMKWIATRRSGPALTVFVEPSALAERVRKCAGVNAVSLWTVPFETCVFRAALERRAEKEPEIKRQKLAREFIFEGFHPLVRGRQLHFRGVFENQNNKPGAKALYLEARLPNATIAEMAKSAEVQQDLGLVRGRENDQEWQARVQSHMLIALQIKQAASYWLGLVHYETGRYDVADDWFKARTLETGEGNQWIPGARYNLARTYAALGDLRAARETLLLDDSAQRHGSLLLARQLRLRSEQPAPSGAKPADAP
jgi:hypothetical protein